MGKKEEITDNTNTKPTPVPNAVITEKSKETKVNMDDKKEDSKDGNENDTKDGTREMESEGEIPS